MTDDTWGLVRNDLLKRIGKNNFVTWIEPLRLAAIENGVARFEVPTVFFGDWVSRNYADQIQSDLKRHGQSVERIEFSLGAGAKPRTATRVSAPPAAPKARAAAEEEFRGAALDARFTFDSFVVGNYRAPIAGTPMPEPASLALFGLGLAALTAMRRRRQI